MCFQSLLRFGYAIQGRNLYLIAWQGQKQLQCDREEDGKIAYTVVGDATQWQESLR